MDGRTIAASKRRSTAANGEFAGSTKFPAEERE